MKGFMLIDGNSLGHYYNNSKTLTIGSLQVQAVFGMLRGVRSLIATFPTLKPVVIWDGASWRKISFPTYKENRERSETENERKLLAARDEYKKQRPLIEGAFRLLGIPQVSAFNMEADDLGAIMTDRYVALGHSILLVTIDQDWLQLVGPKVSWKDVANKRLITASNFEEFTGVKDAKQFVELKAIVGDVGDNVPGIGGIGLKGAKDFLAQYGSVEAFLNEAILEKSIDIKKLPKKFRALVEDEEKAINFRRNVNLVDLRTPMRPAPINLRIDQGQPDRERFEALCEKLLFRSILQDLDEWLSSFPAFREQQTMAA